MNKEIKIGSLIQEIEAVHGDLETLESRYGYEIYISLLRLQDASARGMDFDLSTDAVLEAVLNPLPSAEYWKHLACITPVYGYFQEEGDTMPVPSEAIAWSSVGEALDAFREHADELFQYGERALRLFLHCGTPDGDEAVYGYPEPDFVYRIEGRGKEPVKVIG